MPKVVFRNYPKNTLPSLRPTRQSLSQDQTTTVYLPLEYFSVAKKLPKALVVQNKKPNSKLQKKPSKQKTGEQNKLLTDSVIYFT